MNCLALSFGVFLYVQCFCAPALNATGNLLDSFGEPEPTIEPGAGFIVVAGGADFYYNDRTSVFLLDTYTREWSIMADLPAATEQSHLFYTFGKLLSVGGNNGEASFLMYNSSAPMWTSLTDLNTAVGGGPCGAVLAGSMYLIGGFEQGSGTQVMNPLSFPTWVPGASLQQARFQCGAASLENHIYTCGDHSPDSRGKTCEKYDPTTDYWSFIASMNDYRTGQTLVALNGHLYAVGGNNFGTAERYNPATDTWTYIQPATNKARLASAAVTDGKLIYLIGGCNGDAVCVAGTETDSVEVYIPELNQWEVLPSLPGAREAAAVAYMPQMPK